MYNVQMYIFVISHIRMQHTRRCGLYLLLNLFMKFKFNKMFIKTK